jgi:hypothetical protein
LEILSVTCEPGTPKVYEVPLTPFLLDADTDDILTLRIGIDFTAF